MVFLVAEKSLEVIRLLGPLVRVIRRYDPKLVTQIRNAANSVASCLAEGNGRQGRDRIHLWRIALASAEEVRMELRAAEAWGYVTERQTKGALEVLDHLIRMIAKLVD